MKLKRGMDSIVVLTSIMLCAACASTNSMTGEKTTQPQRGNIPSAGDVEMAGILSKVCLQDKVPAMAVALVTSQGLQKVAAAGVRKWGTDVPVTLEDQWHLGSDTKIMTSTLAAIMVEAGKLKWTSTVSEVFPELSQSFNPDMKNVSLLQLLSHRAGLPTDLDYTAFDKSGSIQDQRIGVVKKALSKKPLSIPGKKFLYSNLGYIIVGAMIERVSGMAWEKAMEEDVFSPLGMKSAGFGGLGTKGQIDQPWGHEKHGHPTAENGAEVDNPAVMGPAGRVHCTIQDWAKFIADQLRGSRGGSALLKPESYQMLQSTHFGGDYALGWAVLEQDWAGGKALTHSGSNRLYLALVWVAPKRDFAVLACTNEGPDSFVSADKVVAQIIKTLER